VTLYFKLMLCLLKKCFTSSLKVSLFSSFILYVNVFLFLPLSWSFPAGSFKKVKSKCSNMTKLFILSHWMIHPSRLLPKIAPPFPLPGCHTTSHHLSPFPTLSIHWLVSGHTRPLPFSTKSAFLAVLVF
jgi:hypothetical protein